jgi:PKD repeat protein
MACKFLDAQGHGSLSDAITCIDYARRKGAKIINASWGDYSYNSTALRDAIDSARNAGIIFVAACGNDNNNNDVNPLYPASFKLDNVVAVAATTRTDGKAVFSNYGATSVHLGAPGDPIFSCWNTSDSAYQYFSGTSMAAPHVAGVCALVWAHYPSDNYGQVINRVLAGAEPSPAMAGKCTTGGRLNLPRALGASPTVVADFTASPASGMTPLTVQFTDTSTGSIVRWQWTFGDGTPNSTNQNPAHVYNNAGTFAVTLTVSGAGGTTSSKSRNIQVTAPATVTANFTANPTSGSAPLMVRFANTSTGNIRQWRWDFGDGTPASTRKSPSHLYAAPDSFMATLAVTGADGSTSSRSQGIVVYQPSGLFVAASARSNLGSNVVPLTASFTAEPVSGTAPLTVKFTDTSTGNIKRWRWRFGDRTRVNTRRTSIPRPARSRLRSPSSARKEKQEG